MGEWVEGVGDEIGGTGEQLEDKTHHLTLRHPGPCRQGVHAVPNSKMLLLYNYQPCFDEPLQSITSHSHLSDTCACFVKLPLKKKLGYADLSDAYIMEAAPGRDTDIT